MPWNPPRLGYYFVNTKYSKHSFIVLYEDDVYMSNMLYPLSLKSFQYSVACFSSVNDFMFFISFHHFPCWVPFFILCIHFILYWGFIQLSFYTIIKFNIMQYYQFYIFVVNIAQTNRFLFVQVIQNVCLFVQIAQKKCVFW